MSKLTLLDFNNAPRQHEVRHDDDDHRDPVTEFRRAMGEKGFIVPEAPVPDGTWRRFGEKNADWYIFNDDPFTGSFGSWKTGETFNWSLKNEAAMDGAELARHRAVVDRQRLAREEEAARQAVEAREKAAKAWAEAQPVEKFPYLERKQIPSLGARLRRGLLIIPAMDAAGMIHTYQTIDATGEKRFLPGGAKRGHFFVIPGEGKTAFVEGFATGASVHVATGWKVVVAFDAGNLAPTIEAYREANPNEELILCADNDHTKAKNTGKETAEAVFKRLGVRFILPTGMAGSDFNDLHTEKGVDEVKKQLLSTQRYALDITKWSIENYLGKPPERQFLVNMTIPMSAVFVLAAMGDAGKGMLTLDLALKVAGVEEKRSANDFNPSVTAFGNDVKTHGPVVILTAEDDKDEVHRRVYSMGRAKAGMPIYIVPLPDAGGPCPWIVPGTNGPQITPAWTEINEQLAEIKPALIVIDPMASFVMADINRDPAVGAYTMGLLAAMSKKTGAAVILCHHLAKTSTAITTPEQARGLVRGTSAIVDNARAAYVLWQVEEKAAKATCQTIGVEWRRNRVFKGCLVKSNGPGDRDIKTFIRNDHGLLEVRNEDLAKQARSNKPMLHDLVVEAIRAAAVSHGPTIGQPYTPRGREGSGIWDRRNELPAELRNISKHQLESIVRELVEAGRVVKCAIGSTKSKSFLDVPDGPFAQGIGEYAKGA